MPTYDAAGNRIPDGPVYLFIGGNLDGQLREVPERRTWSAPEVLAGYDYYEFSNGIARHESVSEEEVARRISKALLVLRSLKSTEGFSDDAKDDLIAALRRDIREMKERGEWIPG